MNQADLASQSTAMGPDGFVAWFACERHLGPAGPDVSCIFMFSFILPHLKISVVFVSREMTLIKYILKKY
jgi:hypothetical protein